MQHTHTQYVNTLMPTRTYRLCIPSHQNASGTRQAESFSWLRLHWLDGMWCSGLLTHFYILIWTHSPHLARRTASSRNVHAACLDFFVCMWEMQVCRQRYSLPQAFLSCPLFIPLFSFDLLTSCAHSLVLVQMWLVPNPNHHGYLLICTC